MIPEIDKMLARATPRSWRHRTIGNYSCRIEAPSGTPSYEGDEGYRIVATYQECTALTLYSEQEANRVANGDLIIVAVNTFEPMREALKKIIELAACVVIPGGENESSQALAFDRGAHKAFEKAAGIARAALPDLVTK